MTRIDTNFWLESWEQDLRTQSGYWDISAVLGQMGRANGSIASIQNGVMNYEDEGMRWLIFCASRPSPH